MKAVERVGVLGPRLRVGQRDLLAAGAGARDQAVSDLGARLHQLSRRRVGVDLIAGQPELLQPLTRVSVVIAQQIVDDPHRIATRPVVAPARPVGDAEVARLRSGQH
ncbi:MAG: hypothetical protein JNK64_21960 [Myxococcales bacterium]|nr:hypothetical protein [Myxococcales bacterium]